MPTPPLSKAIAAQTIEYVNKAIADGFRLDGLPSAVEEGWRRFAADIDPTLNRKTFRGRFNRAIEMQATAMPDDKRAALRGELGTKPVLPGFEIKKTSAQLDADGEVQKEWVQQIPAPALDSFEMPEGHIVKGVSALVDQDGRVRAQWIKTREDPVAANIAEALRDTLANFSAPAIIPPQHSDAELLTVYALPDLHLGMLSWGKETGESYDLEIASKLIREMVGDLVAQSRPSQRAIVLGLGDYFHNNDANNATPRSKHTLDVDGRWPKILRAGAQIAVDLTHLVAAKHELVDVRWLPGNHDPDAAIALTVAMSLFFRNDSRINVIEDPGLHWYHRHGEVLLGATHGHTMRPEAMALMLAADRPQDWGMSKFRHFFFGHIHHESAKEVGAVRVESFASPAAKDGYAHAGGWRSGRALTAITFHATRGEVGRHRVNVIP
jgi:hypothetical protein